MISPSSVGDLETICPFLQPHPSESKQTEFIKLTTTLPLQPHPQFSLQ